MRIYVTQMDIDEGGRGDPTSCAVALALHRQAPHIDWCVDDDSLDLYDDIRTPDCVIDFVGDFDFGKPVQPFWFDIPLVVEQPAQPEAVPA